MNCGHPCDSKMYPCPECGAKSYAPINILKHADRIVNKRLEEKERQYGPFIETMEMTALAFNAITRYKYNLQTSDIYIIYALHKLVREGHKHKYDNLLDAIAYLSSLNDFHQMQKEVNPEEDDEDYI